MDLANSHQTEEKLRLLLEEQRQSHDNNTVEQSLQNKVKDLDSQNDKLRLQISSLKSEKL